MPLAAAIVCTALVLAGAWVFFLPSVTATRVPAAGVPSPPALYAITSFKVQPHREACMGSVAIETDANLAQFTLTLAQPAAAKRLRLAIVLSAAGYHADAYVPRGFAGGVISLPIAPPRNDVVGTACFADRSSVPVLLSGTIEPRTVTRSQTTVNGRPVLGDIALTFFDNHPQTMLDELGVTFQHASNLTDRLIPVLLIWIIAILAAFGMPIAVIAALYCALREDRDAHRI